MPISENVGSPSESGPPEIYDGGILKRVLLPLNVGVAVASHIAWYVSYQVTGEPR